jgi:excisionase family DNA binding protein
MRSVDFWRADSGPFAVAEVAEAARCSAGLVRKAIAAGSLRACRLGRVLRIPRSEAHAFARALGAEPPADFLAHGAHHAHGAHPVEQPLAHGRTNART